MSYCNVVPVVERHVTLPYFTRPARTQDAFIIVTCIFMIYAHYPALSPSTMISTLRCPGLCPS